MSISNNRGATSWNPIILDSESSGEESETDAFGQRASSPRSFNLSGLVSQFTEVKKEQSQERSQERTTPLSIHPNPWAIEPMSPVDHAWSQAQEDPESYGDNFENNADEFVKNLERNEAAMAAEVPKIQAFWAVVGSPLRRLLQKKKHEVAAQAALQAREAAIESKQFFTDDVTKLSDDMPIVLEKSQKANQPASCRFAELHPTPEQAYDAYKAYMKQEGRKKEEWWSFQKFVETCYEGGKLTTVNHKGGKPVQWIRLRFQNRPLTGINDFNEFFSGTMKGKKPKWEGKIIKTQAELDAAWNKYDPNGMLRMAGAPAAAAAAPGAAAAAPGAAAAAAADDDDDEYTEDAYADMEKMNKEVRERVRLEEERDMLQKLRRQRNTEQRPDTNYTADHYRLQNMRASEDAINTAVLNQTPMELWKLFAPEKRLRAAPLTSPSSSPSPSRQRLNRFELTDVDWHNLPLFETVRQPISVADADTVFSYIDWLMEMQPRPDPGQQRKRKEDFNFEEIQGKMRNYIRRRNASRPHGT